MKPAASLVLDALLVIVTVVICVYAVDLMVFGFKAPGLFT